MSSFQVKSQSSLLTRAIFAAAAVIFSMLTVTPQAAAQASIVDFDLAPNPGVVKCLGVPNGPTPTAHVHVVRGKQNDTLTLTASNIRPNLAFDVFTVQRSNLRANGTVNPDVKNFGFAWYQSDLQANAQGNASVVIKTILLDQIFGFDPDLSPTPFNTFNIGFWFNDPADAQACGFDVTKPTPFNGEHRAGPVAMISLPNPNTNLGPLCTNPNHTTTPVSCNP